MKIKLINILRLGRYTFPPYGLGVLKTYLTKQKIKADIFDLDIVVKHLNSKKQQIDITYVKKELWKIPSILRGKNKDDYLDEEVQKIINILSIKPNEVLAFHIPHKEISFSLYLAKKIKERKNCPIIFGGLDIIRKSKTFLEDLIKDFGINYVDHFVCGDPYTFFDRLTANQLPLTSSKPIINFDQVSKPEADWDIPNFNKEHLDFYRVNPRKAEHFFPELSPKVIEKLKELKGANRPLIMPYKFQFGCYNRCAYCGFGKSPEKLPVDRVMRDIEHLKTKYKTKNFYFLNTNIAINKDYTRELTERLTHEQDIRWSDTANLNMTTPETIRNFGKSGCVELFMGFTTASEKLHRYVGRGPRKNPLEHFSKCFQATKENGIWLVTDMICGLPYERKEDIEKTKRFLLKHKPYIDGILINKFVMMKNSPFAQTPEKYGLRLYPKKYSFESLTSNKNITMSNFGGLDFDEKHGLNRTEKIRQIEASGRFFNNFIKKNFPTRIYSWYPIFLLYNNFNTKKEIKNFLESDS